MRGDILGHGHVDAMEVGLITVEVGRGGVVTLDGGGHAKHHWHLEVVVGHSGVLWLFVLLWLLLI